MTRDLVKELCDLLDTSGAKVQFGLRAQGHIPTIDRMLSDGSTWEDIGRAIGWVGDAARRDYETDQRIQALQRANVPVLVEILTAMAKYPTWPTDPLHAVAVLGEEFGELTKAVLQHTYEPQKASLRDVRDEAIQTAAMALRFVLSLDLYAYERCDQHVQIEVRS